MGIKNCHEKAYLLSPHGIRNASCGLNQSFVLFPIGRVRIFERKIMKKIYRRWRNEKT